MNQQQAMCMKTMKMQLQDMTSSISSQGKEKTAIQLMKC